ncbi:NAD-dependent epimerase/dehydratase family protein [Streptomyces nodosus]|uniref:NAD-dependent epimerase/dehydratase family protein n=1 Tax=Streptomyces nodosus TaxID=40318 RepID=UPI00382044DE
MKILVLGGTWFLGRAVAQAALDRGWSVTAFNRGRSGTAPEGTHEIRGDRTVHADLLRLGEQGPWDAVIDTSASNSPRAMCWPAPRCWSLWRADTSTSPP